MDCSTPGSLSSTISRSLLRFMFIESVMPSNNLILFCPLLLLPSIFPQIGVFSNESALHIRWPQRIGVSAPASVLPMNTQGWFPLRLTGLISLQSKELSRVFCSTTIPKSKAIYQNKQRQAGERESWHYLHHCIQSSLRPVLPWSSQPQECAVTQRIHVCVRLKRCPWRKYGGGVVKSGGPCPIGGLCLSLPMQESCLGTLAGGQKWLHSVLVSLLGAELPSRIDMVIECCSLAYIFCPSLFQSSQGDQTRFSEKENSRASVSAHQHACRFMVPRVLGGCGPCSWVWMVS